MAFSPKAAALEAIPGRLLQGVVILSLSVGVKQAGKQAGILLYPGLGISTDCLVVRQWRFLGRGLRYCRGGNDKAWVCQYRWQFEISADRQRTLAWSRSTAIRAWQLQVHPTVPGLPRTVLPQVPPQSSHVVVHTPTSVSRPAARLGHTAWLQHGDRRVTGGKVPPGGRQRAAVRATPSLTESRIFIIPSYANYSYNTTVLLYSLYEISFLLSPNLQRLRSLKPACLHLHISPAHAPFHCISICPPFIPSRCSMTELPYWPTYRIGWPSTGRRSLSEPPAKCV
ncbi:hypothetical protein F4861DRAFT_57172 [Xylaria intraflava]|nr:hypothetical protein F4861DRAFT_57172 [Xylaria intraflava]